MFKKLKDKIGEEFKQAPLKFPVSVQQLAQVISPSQSVNSLSDNNASSSSLTYPADMSNVSTDFFSIGGDDDPQDGIAKMPLTLHSVDLTVNSPSNMTQNISRSRRSSLSSVTSEASSLFPIYEGGLNQNFFQSDLESEMEDGMSGQLEKISKEQLYQSFKKILNRYNKYKGRYTDLMKHYKELQHDNFKTKNVLQESQDKALRRIAELREQCQLEQKAKAHLEESLRNDVEERDHIINTLKTKISLLSNGADSGQLIEVDADSEGNKPESNSQSKELCHLKSQNEDLQREVERLKKIKETACNFIHRCDTTINEATEDVKSDNIKQKMSELKSEIQKMKSENESLSHLLSRNIITEEDRKLPATSGENNLIADLSGLESSQGEQKVDEREKKIEKLNNLLLKCKEKISSLNAELKAKDLMMEENNKKVKELREEVEACKLREEKNALSVAENKKAIHEELSAKEEQIKALTKELKTKENEFIKEKADVMKSYEDKLRDIESDHKKEMKLKTDEIQKLQEDLKAKEIVSGTLDKVKSIEENFANMLEFVRMRSSAFEEFANTKTAEIESAQQRLEERLTSAGKNLTEVLQSARKAKAVEEMETVTQQKLFETHSKWRNPNAELSENFHTVEKLKSDVSNLSKKLEILESELEKTKNEAKSEKEEKDKWRDKHTAAEAELAKIQREFEEKLNENAELGKALTDKNEKIKKVESEKTLLQRASNEKVETESKLREYIENYNKLEKENRTLQNDLVEKCGKLLKELNDSKEKVKNLENQEKAKVDELEAVKNQYSREEKIKSEENERLKKEIEALRNELSLSGEEVEKMKVLTKEGEKAKEELEKLEEKMKEQGAELEKRGELTKELESELANVRKEMSQEKRSFETIRNELDALRNNLKLELKEKDEKSILVDKLTHECNLLMAEIENLKKTHGKIEKKLENDLEDLKKEVSEKTNLIEKLEGELEKNKKEQEDSSAGMEELRKECERLTGEVNQLKEQQTGEEAVKVELRTANEELRNKLLENEKLRQELTDQISGLTNEKNEMFGELQVKVNEIETLKNGLKSMREELGERAKAFEEEKLRLMSENENKLNVLKNEIKFINTKHEEDIGNFEENLNSEMKEVSEKMEVAEKASAELLEKLERITSERDELKMAEEEKNMKISELESCLMGLKMELDEKFNEDVKEDEELSRKHEEEVKQIIMQYDKEIAERDDEIELLKMKYSNEEEANNSHREEVKQIILQYDKEIAERDEEIDALKSKLLGFDDALEHLKNSKEELKLLRRELAEKDSVLEEKLEETIRLKEDGSRVKGETENAEEAVKELRRMLEEEKAETERLRREKETALEVEQTKWREKMAELREKHERELKSWNSEKKNENVNTEMSGGLAEPECQEKVALESTSKVAVAALESGSGSIELLQKQLIQQAAEMKELKKQHKREIIDLKKMSGSRGRRGGRRNSSENQDWLSGGGLENDTEHEYLRNILYEYMMGKEQLVLAKVLSAIVRFNEEQTNNVLEKEQQRQTLRESFHIPNANSCPDNERLEEVKNYKERLVIYGSSYVCLVFMTRTFTNTVEITCFNILLCLVASCMAESEKELLSGPRRTSKNYFSNTNPAKLLVSGFGGHTTEKSPAIDSRHLSDGPGSPWLLAFDPLLSKSRFPLPFSYGPFVSSISCHCYACTTFFFFLFSKTFSSLPKFCSYLFSNEFNNDSPLLPGRTQRGTQLTFRIDEGQNNLHDKSIFISLILQYKLSSP